MSTTGATSSFRFNAKSVFLTYPRCPCTKEHLLQCLRKNLEYNGVTIDAYIICLEKHQDEGLHLHAVLKFNKKLNKRDERFADIMDMGITYHPNIQPVKSLKSSVIYLKKDGDFIEHGFNFDTKRKFDELITADTAEEFWELAKEVSARDYILQHEKLEYYVNKRFKKTLEPFVPKFSLSSFIIPEVIMDWKSQLNVDRPKSLLLCGESRLGKTQLIRTMFPNHCYWNCWMDLSTFNSDVDILILDDFEWDKIPNKKGLVGAQQTIVLTDKYRRKQTVSWGKPCVILMNNMPSLSKWDEANLFVHIVFNKLFVE